MAGCNDAKTLSPAEAELAAGIKRLGGEAERDSVEPSSPIIDVDLITPTDATVERLKLFPQLRRIDLGGTKVTDSGLGHLHDFRALKWINLGGTKMTAKGVSKLKTAHRRIEVVR